MLYSCLNKKGQIQNLSDCLECQLLLEKHVIDNFTVFELCFFFFFDIHFVYTKLNERPKIFIFVIQSAFLDDLKFNCFQVISLDFLCIKDFFNALIVLHFIRQAFPLLQSGFPLTSQAWESKSKYISPWENRPYHLLPLVNTTILLSESHSSTAIPISGPQTSSSKFRLIAPIQFFYWYYLEFLLELLHLWLFRSPQRWDQRMEATRYHFEKFSLPG